jgi:hypothetical protein
MEYAHREIFGRLLMIFSSWKVITLTALVAVSTATMLVPAWRRAVGGVLVRRGTSQEAKNAVMDRWTEHKSRLMEASLGKEHDRVMHAIVPFYVGGTLDAYFYPNGVAGTGIATKELSELPNSGSRSDTYSCYELVMFTRRQLDVATALDEKTPFGRAYLDIDRILNAVARYSREVKLNPRETLEFPGDIEGLGGKCIVFDGYAVHSDHVVRRFGLLLVIEVFRREMEFAQKHGTAQLIEKLKARGAYPYSDLDREPVV